MKLSNGLLVYCKSMGKVFRVRHIARDTDEANEFCAKHRDTGAIAECRQTGLVFIADLYSLTVPSSFLPDSD